ncbi:PIG-L family deacetylase [Croceiramulus getboli]|nr:PIG-L family deacetylase [Flavobacteriaceae bacterium YJPT1-3]
MRNLFLIGLCFVWLSTAWGQGITLTPEKPSSATIYEDLLKLNFLGTVLYVAAHPDDENTAMISYFENDVHARTIYLSMTRGDGGQNLIGPELRELLGLIRTQELLAARRTDGGEQRFTRANDFGYSKHPDETLEIWNKDQVLHDVVWAIRKLQPDIIINRFDHRSPGSTHGHHTSSAMLSVEAFDLAGDPNAYPEQLDRVDIWQPKRQFFNTSWWFYGSRENFEKADKSNLVTVDLGSYYPNYGLSNTEISALSRSQHKSQGFGNTGRRGQDLAYLEFIQGDQPTNGAVFSGIDTSWNRVPGGAPIAALLNDLIKNYDFRNPSASVPRLVEVYRLIDQLEAGHWKSLKKKEIKTLIADASGLFLEAIADQPQATPGQSLSINLEAINRSAVPMQLQEVQVLPRGKRTTIGQALDNNKGWEQKIETSIPQNAQYSSAYWLRNPGTLGMYAVEDPNKIGLPETPVEHQVAFTVSIAGQNFTFERPLRYKYNDRVDGEVYQPLEIVPPVTVALEDDVIIFAEAKPKTIKVQVTAYQDNLNGNLELRAPSSAWSVSPSTASVTLAKKGATQEISFTVTPPASASEGTLTPVFTTQGQQYADKMITIDYDHIPLQTVLLPADARVVRLDIKRKGDYIGYIAGAGDAVPESLEQIGYQVALIDPASITTELLKQFDAVVLGIRAYNVVEELQQQQTKLLEYVEQGGTLITQYNTSGRWTNTQVGAPYTLELSRDRVTDENSKVTIVSPQHPALNYPNKITAADFEGWTQERGLYFPDKWSEEYTPLLRMNDPGEAPTDGSLLVTQYGKGHYVYTGLSFFREFPAGVAGAYRLFANLLALGKEQETEKIKG